MLATNSQPHGTRPRISLIAPCVRPGADGVGDYALVIARALVPLGCEVQCLGFGDYHEDCVDMEWREPGVRSLNLNAHGHSGERLKRVADEVSRFSPDLVAVQYYWRGFRSGGGHAALARALDASSRRALRLMMYHEALFDVDPRSRLHAAARSLCIAGSITLFHHWLRPELSSTTCRPNAEALALLGIDATCVPVPANIERANATDPRNAEAVARLQARLMDLGPKRPFVGLTFGRLAPDLPAAQIASALEKRRSQSAGDRPGFLVSIGRSAYADRGWDALRREALALGWQCAKLGVLPPEEISLWIQAADIGIVPTPRAYLDKSGTHAAFVAHGLSVLTLEEALYGDAAPTPKPPVVQTPGRIAAQIAAIARTSILQRSN